MNNDKKLNKDLYVCRCACGQAFPSAYLTTRLCPGCSLGLALADYAPEPDADDSLFAAAGYLCCHPFGGISAYESLGYRAGCWQWALVLLAVVCIALLIGYGGAMGQAEGWGQ